MLPVSEAAHTLLGKFLGARAGQPTQNPPTTTQTPSRTVTVSTENAKP